MYIYACRYIFVDAMMTFSDIMNRFLTFESAKIGPKGVFIIFQGVGGGRCKWGVCHQNL